MTFIAYLVLLTALTPAPTFMIVDEFKSHQNCEDAKAEFVKERSLPEQQSRRLKCLTIVTSPLKDA